MKRHLWILFFSAFSALGVDASPIRLTVAVEPAAELPAIPVTLRVQATNPTDVPVTFGNVIALQVVPLHGEPFAATGGPRTGAVTSFPWMPNEITLAPGETRDLTIWASSDTPFFGYEKRLWRPGSYQLQIVISPELARLRDMDVRVLADEVELSDPILSNEVTLTVLEPQGDDAKVYALIQSTEGWWDAELASMIWRDYSHTRYAPYAVPQGGNEIAAYEAAISKAPDAVIAEQWRYNVAQTMLSDLRRVRSEQDIARTEAVMRRAEPILQDLAASARNPKIRADATELLAKKVLSRAQLEYMLKRDRGEITDIEPSIVCTAQHGKRGLVAWLTYYNPSRDPRMIAVGERNKFTPPPFDRGQPTLFKINARTEWFKVISDSPVLTWHIDSTNFTIDSSHAPRPCPTDMDEYHDEYFSGSRPWPDGPS